MAARGNIQTALKDRARESREKAMKKGHRKENKDEAANGKVHTKLEDLDNTVQLLAATLLPARVFLP